MANNRTPRATGVSTTARPPAGTDTSGERDDDNLPDEEDDDAREGAAERGGAATEASTPAGESSPSTMDALFAAAKKKLGLSPDASPADLLKAIAGATNVRPAGPPRAACSLVLVVEGKRVVLAEGDLIPEGVDLADLERRHPHAVARS